MAKKNSYYVKLTLDLGYHIDANNKDEAASLAEEEAIRELQGLNFPLDLNIVGIEKF